MHLKKMKKMKSTMLMETKKRLNFYENQLKQIECSEQEN